MEFATLEWLAPFDHRRLLGSDGHVPPSELEAAFCAHAAQPALAA